MRRFLDVLRSGSAKVPFLSACGAALSGSVGLPPASKRGTVGAAGRGESQ
jgi:hypothetical protein